MPWWLALKNTSMFPNTFPPGNALVAGLFIPRFSSRDWSLMQNLHIWSCHCIGALDEFFPQNLLWSSPSSRVLILLAVRDLLLLIGILESVFCRGMGDTKYFDILDVIFFNESNDVRFFRDIIWANPIAGVWLGYLHIFQQVSYSQ